MLLLLLYPSTSASSTVSTSFSFFVVVVVVVSLLLSNTAAGARAMPTSPPFRSAAAILDDAKAFAAYASAAVELSDAHVSTTTATGNLPVLSVTRSVRDIDQGKRRRYLYQIPLASTTNAAFQQQSPLRLQLPPVELPDTLLARIPSATGDKMAVFREEVIPDAPKRQQVLEVWTNNGSALLRRIPLPETLHGKLVLDAGGFGMPIWNAQGTVVCYLAERKAPTTTSFFADQYDDLIHEERYTGGGSASSSGSSGSDSDDPPARRGAQHTLGYGKTEKWGEKYAKHSALLDLFLVNVETGRIQKLCNCPGHHSSRVRQTTEGSYTLGQPVFSPDGQSLVYVAWDAGGGTDMPRRLGLVYCLQRPSKLYASPIAKLLERIGRTETETMTPTDCPGHSRDGAPSCLTLESRLARSPRFAPTSDATTTGTSKLVFLCSDRGFDTHSGCWGLDVMEWNTNDSQPVPASRRTLVDPVWNPNADSPATSGSVLGLLFPGLFLQALPDYPFLSSDYMLLTTQWGSSSRMVRISLNGETPGDLKVINTGHIGHCSDTLLYASLEGGVVFQTAAPNRVPTVWHVPASALIESTTLMQQDKTSLPPMLPMAASKYSAVPQEPDLDFNCDIQLLNDLPRVDGIKVDGLPVHTILLMPNLSKHPNPPLIVVPHGGPHSVSSTSYVPSIAFLCGHGGYAVALVNYRGSTGFGQGLIESLPTRIGTLDVQDMAAATIKIRDSGLVDPNRIGICGGSHGGFLAGHCTGQYPDLFRVAAMRNPVVNIPSMTTATDIPDWCFIEAVGSYDWQDYGPPTPDELQIMWEKSPIRYIQNVKAPTLVALGLKDLRVPPSQGLEWFYTLRARRVCTKLMTYDEDDHAIAGAQAESDHWINIKRWFDKHL